MHQVGQGKSVSVTIFAVIIILSLKESGAIFEPERNASFSYSIGCLSQNAMVWDVDLVNHGSESGVADLRSGCKMHESDDTCPTNS
jgi:hypothetical protein